MCSPQCNRLFGFIATLHCAVLRASEFQFAPLSVTLLPASRAAGPCSRNGTNGRPLSVSHRANVEGTRPKSYLTAAPSNLRFQRTCLFEVCERIITLLPGLSFVSLLPTTRQSDASRDDKLQAVYRYTYLCTLVNIVP